MPSIDMKRLASGAILCLVIKSMGLSFLGSLNNLSSRERTFCWIHRSAVARWGTRPRPWRLQMPIPAVVSEWISSLTGTPKSEMSEAESGNQEALSQENIGGESGKSEGANTKPNPKP